MFKTKNSKKNSKIVLNTSALPDIIFMLLFFFMVVTVMRKDPALLKIKMPIASELQKLENPSLINHIYIGQRMGIKAPQAGVAIQIQDAFVSVDQLQNAIKALVAAKPEHLQALVNTALKVDESVEMGIVDDVKIALRKEGQLKLNYLAIGQDN